MTLTSMKAMMTLHSGKARVSRNFAAKSKKTPARLGQLPFFRSEVCTAVKKRPNIGIRHSKLINSFTKNPPNIFKLPTATTRKLFVRFTWNLRCEGWLGGNFQVNQTNRSRAIGVGSWVGFWVTFVWLPCSPGGWCAKQFTGLVIKTKVFPLCTGDNNNNNIDDDVVSTMMMTMMNKGPKTIQML